MGGPRLLLSQQIVFGHRAPPGRQVQERDHSPLVAQLRPEEGDLELHPLCVRNTVRRLLFTCQQLKHNFDTYKTPTFHCKFGQQAFFRFAATAMMIMTTVK